MYHQDVVLALLSTGREISMASSTGVSHQSSATVLAAASCHIKMDDQPTISPILPEPCKQTKLNAAVSYQVTAGNVAPEPSSSTQAPGSSIRSSLQPANASGRVRKLWLHTAVEPVPGGSGSLVCLYCGATLSSNNISVRKKVDPISI